MNSTKTSNIEYVTSVAVLTLFLLIGSSSAISETNTPSFVQAEPKSQVPQSADLVDERPSTLGMVWGYSTQAVGWVWTGLYNNVLYWVSPPSTSSLVSSVSKPDAIKLFKLLKSAGYKLKTIDTDVGIIPGIKIKFGQVRELSDADIEYLDSQVEAWEEDAPGMYDAIQRSIIKTVMAVNASGDYRVTSLEVKLLPLPDVAFTMIPKKVFLGEESSVLMRAIQRVERSIRTLKEDSKPAIADTIPKQQPKPSLDTKKQNAGDLATMQVK